MTSKKRRSTSFADHILTVFGKSPYRSFNYKQLAAQMGIKDKASKHMILTAVESFTKQGVLIESNRGKYKLSEKHLHRFVVGQKSIIGKVDMKKTGKAYIIPDDGSPDIFVSHGNTNHSLNGDTVKVSLFPQRKNRKLEGEVVEIIKRDKMQFAGTLSVMKKYAFLVPDNPRMPVDIFIPKEAINGGKHGYKAVVEIEDWPETAAQPFGRVIEVLGRAGETQTEMQAILFDNNVPTSFEADVEAAAEKFPETIPAEEIKKRKDLRKVTTYTIDPEDAKDFDDAISFRRLKNGRMEIGVHIADVSYYVQPDSILDKEAFERATSVYLVDRVIPMLPERLSNGLCSLRPNEDKLCFSALFEMDEQGKVHDRWFGSTVINSDRRFNYAEAQAVIEGDSEELKDEILSVHHLAEKLREKRFSNGAINFESQEVKFNLDKKGNPIGVYIKEGKEANWLIEEFMLLANRSVATEFGKIRTKGGGETPRTMVYRVHDDPSPEKLLTFSRFVSKLGYQIDMQSRSALSKSMNKLFSAVAGKGEQTLIETIAVRTMTKAFYTTDNIGHYGLAFDNYTHFTSPIRRYPDLMVHRLMRTYIEKGALPQKELLETKCKHCSEMEIKAKEAERASVKYMQAVFLEKQVGKDFEGTISGISKWGIYVEIKENRCEGMVRLNSLRDDFYFIDEENYRVVGQSSGTIYKLGDTVGINIKNVDVESRQIDFEML